MFHRGIFCEPSPWEETFGSNDIIYSYVFNSTRYESAIESLFHGPMQLRLTAVAEFLREVASIDSWCDNDIARIQCFIRQLLACRGILPYLADLCAECARKIEAANAPVTAQ